MHRNQEQQNKMPVRTRLQWLLSEQQQPPAPVSLERREAGVGQQDPWLSQAEAAVRRLDGTLGRDYDGHSACMAASVARLAKSNGLSCIDHIVLSEGNGTSRKGENLFVVQGALNDPANHWAHMRTQDAVITPVEKSVARLQTPGETQQLQAAVSMADPEREIARQPRMG